MSKEANLVKVTFGSVVRILRSFFTFSCFATTEVFWSFPPSSLFSTVSEGGSSVVASDLRSSVLVLSTASLGLRSAVEISA